MDKYSKFNSEFFSENKDIKWFGKKGLLALNQEQNAEIVLSTGNVSGTYDRYKIKIVNKLEGLISDHVFKFDDYFSKRVDSRPDYKNGFAVIDHCFAPHEKGWYIAEPSKEETKKLAAMIFEYIEAYSITPAAKEKKSKTR